LAVASSDHRLTVEFERGYPYAQVFVPPGQRFVCLEPMTASVNALGTGRCPLVGPGEVFTARYSIAIQHLNR
jgi:aldose 1-epimerase